MSASLAEQRGRRSDQSAVWNSIELKMMRMQVRSQTGAMADLYDARQVSVEEYAAAIQPAPDHIAAVFCIDGRISGIDLFDFSATMPS